MTNTDATQNNTSARRRKNGQSLWGWGVALLYAGFALFILVLVGYASLQDFQLVEDNYYEKGITYQGQIDKRTNAAGLARNLSWEFDAANGALTIFFPDDFVRENITGDIALFRPSNAHLDKTLAIAADSLNRQTIDCKDIAKGKWELKIDWAVGERSFYFEDMLIIE